MVIICGVGGVSLVPQLYKTMLSLMTVMDTVGANLLLLITHTKKKKLIKIINVRNNNFFL
jgi:hypothetical protein